MEGGNNGNNYNDITSTVAHGIIPWGIVLLTGIRALFSYTLRDIESIGNVLYLGMAYACQLKLPPPVFHRISGWEGSPSASPARSRTEGLDSDLFLHPIFY